MKTFLESQKTSHLKMKQNLISLPKKIFLIFLIKTFAIISIS